MAKFSLRQKIRSWLFEDQDNEVELEPLNRDSDSPQLHGEPIRLNVYVANGGTIVETRVYDHHKDHHRNTLYVVNSDTDLGEELSKIITLTSLVRWLPV